MPTPPTQPENDKAIISTDPLRPFADTPAPSKPPSDTVPWELPGDRYRVIGEIARGGMGVVLRVHDACFDRPLAIKVLLSRHRPSPDEERRFLEEAGITGRLQHPGIPPAHDIGRMADGRPFFSMKLIEGRTLADLLGERPTPQVELPHFLKVFEQIAQTLAYAHSQGIIHRDLKPLNVMVGAFGEVQVMDWGLAKRLPREHTAAPAPPGATAALDPAGDEKETLVANPVANPDSGGSHTQAGEVIGTLAYMSPEQARGEIHELDERCDVFGLGAILCTILTGGPPYVGSDRSALFQQAQEGDLAGAWARLDASGADPELVHLARECLAPKKEDRPRDAAAVARSIDHYLESVQERLRQAEVARAQAEVKAREEGKRRRLALVLAVTLLLLALVAGGAGLWYLHDRAETATRRNYLEREIDTALDEAERQRQELHGRLQDERRAALLLSEPEQWQQLLDSTRAAWKRADALAAGDREMVPAAMLERLTALAEQLDADEIDFKLGYALDRIRLESLKLVKGEIEPSHAAPKLAEVFREAGYDVNKSDPGQLAARVRRSPIRLPLVAGLDFWAQVIYDRPLRARLLEVARTADPQPWRDRFRQANVWDDRGKLEALAREVDCAAQPPYLLSALAYRLRRTGGDAPAVLRRALVHHPRDFWLFFELGHLSKDPTEQAGAFRAALAIRPDSGVVYYSVGVLQQGRGKLDEARACYRRAIELEPAHAGALTNLGLVLDELNWPGEALGYYRRAVKVSPDGVVPLINLGSALFAQRQLDEAIDCFHRVLRIDPRHVVALNNLGAALRAQNKLDQATECFRQAIGIEDKHAMAWCNLGHVLRQQGEYVEGLAAMQRGHELGSREKDWSYPSAEWVKEAEYSVMVERKLPAVLRGEATPADAREQLAMADLCHMHRKLYVAAVRFYAAAFAADPRLVGDLLASQRYNAACAAVQAATGQGKDAGQLNDVKRAELRQQALGWLGADLTAWTEALEKRTPAANALTQTLRHWQKDPDLAGVRDDLAGLPSSEQVAWRQLWADVMTLQQRAAKGTR